jgi:alkylation response protein AidB-like acyl-CoA dehydrogenase
MATQQVKPAGKPEYAPPPIEGDFYRIAAVLNDSERALLKRVREFTEGVVAPVIEDYWARDAFPFEIIPKMAEVGFGGVGYQGYGAAGGSWLPCRGCGLFGFYLGMPIIQIPKFREILEEMLAHASVELSKAKLQT